MALPKSAIGRLFDFFHTHPRGRLYEWVFFTAIGLAIGGASYFFYARDDLAEPIYWLLLVVAACFVGFALLPQKKHKAPPSLLKGKRGELAEQRKKHKHKKKGPPPPIR
ncbi:MAG: hypothetical protein WDA16_02985 [Candidatus Thermoplasmatota archaeon]